MNRYLLLLLLIFTTCRMPGQVNNIIPGKNYYRYWAAKLPLANMADIVSPNFLIGIERRFDKHNAVQLLAGPSIDDPTAENKSGNVFNGFRVRGEYRRYFKVRPLKAFFLACELYYSKYNSAVERAFSLDTFNRVNYTDKYMLHKNNYGVNLKFGFHKSFRHRKDFTKHLMFDAYAGMGVKYKNTTQTGRSRPLDEPTYPRHPNIWHEAYREGAGATIGMTVNFMIGYIFR